MRFLVIYPYPNLDTNPTMALLLESLAQRGVTVDVLVEEGREFLSPAAFGATVQLIPLHYSYFKKFWQPTLGSFGRRLALRCVLPKQYAYYRAQFDPFLFSRRQMPHYDLVIGVDPHGIVLANRLNSQSGKPLVYISFEILFGEEAAESDAAELVTLERAASQRTTLVMIQDDERADAFCRETGFPRTKVALVPVAAPTQKLQKTDFLRKKLGIPAQKRIVLSCGSLDAWSSRDELAELVSYWPDNYCLVVHNRARATGGMSRYLQQLQATGKIYISSEPVSRTELVDLVASADFGLAPYKPVPGGWYSSGNLYHLGFASGKVSYYALCGLPMLARPLPVFERTFSKYDCGRIYQRLADSGKLLEELNADYSRHSAEARRFYDEQLNPTGPMNNFCDQLLRTAEIGDQRSESRG